MKKTIIGLAGFLVFSCLLTIVSAALIQIDLDSNLLQSKTGETLFAKITIGQLGSEKEEYIVEILLSDKDGNAYYKKEQTVTIDRLTSFTAEITTPTGMPDGKYNIIVEVTDSQTRKVWATAVETISIKNGEFFNYQAREKFWSIWAIWILLIITAIFITVTYILYKKNRKELRGQKISLQAIVSRSAKKARKARSPR